MIDTISLRDLISRIMLTIDEMWLTQSERTRLVGTVTPADVLVEDTLFQAEAMIQAAAGIVNRREEQARSGGRAPVRAFPIASPGADGRR